MPAKTKIPISLCMIVKNEERFLERAISSVKKLMGVSDVVVADTGSDDNTKAIAAACGARVFDFEWCGDFAAARNFAASMAENDWIIKLDADEEVAEADMKKTLKLLSDENARGVAMMLELSDNSIHESDMLYNRKTHSFYGSIHENIRPLDGFATQRVQVPVLINHSGYLPEVQNERSKFERNISMLEKELAKNPNDSYYLYHMGKSHFNFDRDLEKACMYFEKVLSIEDNVALGYIYTTVECYGYALINTGKYREALNLIDVYSKYYKVKPEFRFLMGHIYQNNAMFVEAVECFESCVGADMPADPTGITSYLSLYNIAVILECLEMFEDAAEMYENCGDYGPAKARLEELRKGKNG